MAQERFEFDEVNGIFRVNGKQVPRVSDIMVKGGIVDPTWFTEESRIRGTAVHHAVFLDIFGDLHVESLHPVVRPYLDAWFLFKKLSRFKPIEALCEKRLYQPVYGYVGRPDILGWLNGRPTLIDIKSGGDGAARYQLAAYREFPEVLAYQPARFSLCLKKTATFKLNEWDDPRDWNRFYDALVQTREAA